MKQHSPRNTAILNLAKKGPLRARDLDALGVPRVYLRRLVEQGLLERVDRGLYLHAEARLTELHSVAEVMKRIPSGTVCLLSALQMHGLTTEVPHAVWVLIDRHARAPRITSPKVEFVRASGPALKHGVDQRTIEGVAIRLTSPAKSVVDCFRYRRHVGMETALDALRDYLRRANGPLKVRGECTHDALAAAAKATRTTNLLRPYLEALA